ncbi:hypothetical protein ACFYXL_27595 [Streptomyces tsukubensis]|uniref:hypothetical protein n=1 Tax=Streptomyces tsukubensis TaxID=83656 RepID=UPI00369C7CEE
MFGVLRAHRSGTALLVAAASPAVVRLRGDNGDNSDNSDSGGEGSGPWRRRTEFSSPPPVRSAPAS